MQTSMSQVLTAKQRIYLDMTYINMRPAYLLNKMLLADQTT